MDDGTLHGQIQSDILTALNRFVSRVRPLLAGKAYVFADTFPLSGVYPSLYKGLAGRMPDAVVDVRDGFGPIFIEVGQMKPPDKWEDIIISPEPAQIRVLRVGFDRGVALMGGRDSETEMALVSWLAHVLARPEQLEAF